MTKHNAKNERIKRDYFHYLVQAKGRDEATIDGVAKSLARFEQSTRAKDFKRFHREQAVAFKAGLAKAHSARTGEKLSKATLHSTLRDLRAFFFWLAHLPGFKSHIAYADADYFNLSDKDVTIARARREKPFRRWRRSTRCSPPCQPPRCCTGATGHFSLSPPSRRKGGGNRHFPAGTHRSWRQGFIEQDARTVHTKFAKTFRTYFMPIGWRNGLTLAIVADWIDELQREHLWGPADPLFPSTKMGLNPEGGFMPTALRATAGLPPGRSAPCSSAPSRRLACPISTRTLSATCWYGTRWRWACRLKL